MKHSNKVKSLSAMLAAAYLLSGCGFHTVHEEYQICRSKSGQFEIQVDLRASLKKDEGITVYGSPYDVVVVFLSNDEFSHGEVVNIALSESGDNAGLAVHESSMTIMEAKQSENVYWAYGKDTSVDLPYKNYTLTAAVVLDGNTKQFHCQLQKSFKEYQEGFFDAVWGGI